MHSLAFSGFVGGWNLKKLTGGLSWKIIQSPSITIPSVCLCFGVSRDAESKSKWQRDCVERYFKVQISRRKRLFLCEAETKSNWREGLVENYFQSTRWRKRLFLPSFFIFFGVCARLKLKAVGRRVKLEENSKSKYHDSKCFSSAIWTKFRCFVGR